MAERINAEAIRGMYGTFVSEARRNGLDTSEWVFYNAGGGAAQMRVMGRLNGGLYQLNWVPDSGWLGNTFADVHETLRNWTSAMAMVRMNREDMERKANG